MRIATILLAALFLLCGCQSNNDANSQSAPKESSGPPESIEDSTPASTAEQSRESPPEASLSSLPESDSSQAEPEAPPLTKTITVPEGYTLARIGMLLEAEGMCTTEEFIVATQEGDFGDYSLIAAQHPSEERCFKLEGYLFPATYEIYSDEPPSTVIHRMLAHMEKKIDSELRQQVSDSGYTFDEILTLASIVEKESFGHDQMPYVSSVLHNRLDSGMQLQCDVTITYVEGAIKPFITGDVNRYNSFYNTYKCAALPAGPICNPGIDAIRAALAPADTDYLFFVTDADQNYYYATTWEDHLANVETAGL